MADVEIKYKDAVIATLDETGTKTLKTSGKYCESDITVSYTKSAVPAETNHRRYEYDNPAAVSGGGKKELLEKPVSKQIVSLQTMGTVRIRQPTRSTTTPPSRPAQAASTSHRRAICASMAIPILTPSPRVRSSWTCCGEEVASNG